MVALSVLIVLINIYKIDIIGGYVLLFSYHVEFQLYVDFEG